MDNNTTAVQPNNDTPYEPTDAELKAIEYEQSMAGDQLDGDDYDQLEARLYTESLSDLLG